MRNIQHANKQQTAYRANRKALNNFGKQKDRSKAGKRKKNK